MFILESNFFPSKMNICNFLMGPVYGAQDLPLKRSYWHVTWLWMEPRVENMHICLLCVIYQCSVAFTFVTKLFHYKMYIFPDFHSVIVFCFLFENLSHVVLFLMLIYYVILKVFVWMCWSPFFFLLSVTYMFYFVFLLGFVLFHKIPLDG